MLRLNTLAPQVGARKASKRVGRGQGSGRGQTATRGHKGSKARSGYGIRLGFEGGQMPLQRRLPKGGFTNIFRKEYTLVSLSDLEVFDANVTVDRAALAGAGLIKSLETPVKILANGSVSKPLSIQVDKISQKARELIIAAGGTVKE